MADWLVDEAVVRRSGQVLSWVNPDHPGYPYPEIGGLWLRWAKLRGVVPELRARVSAWLRAALDDDCVGRDGVRYTFDAGVVLAGLDAEEGGTSAHWQRLVDRIASGTATLPPLDARWSTRVGPHFLKLASGALRAARPATVDVAAALATIDVRMGAGGRIFTSPDDSTYAHAHAYAVEGLLALAHDESPLPSARKRRYAAAAQQGAHWLVTVQRPSGGIPASYEDGEEGVGPSRSDATAQAIRIWLLTDPDRFRPAIERALAFLRNVTHDCGGVRYDDTCDDLNTWATIFAEQALSWAEGETADALALL